MQCLKLNSIYKPTHTIINIVHSIWYFEVEVEVMFGYNFF